MVVLVPTPDVLQSSFTCSKWTLRRSDILGNWRWIRGSCMDDVDQVPELGAGSHNISTMPQEAVDRSTIQPTDGWTAEESAYLMDLCREHGNRFIVVADRYSFAGPKKSLLDIKQRYYEISGEPYDSDGERRKRLAEESFEARPAELIDEEQQLIRLLQSVQINFRSSWKKRQELIARVAGDTFLMNNPGLPDILGLTEAVADSVEEKLAASGSKRRDRDRKKGSNKKRVRRAVDEQPPSTASAATKKQTITPILRTSILKPVKAGLSRQVDKAMIELGLPLRPVYPSERNCECYDQIRSILADQVENCK